MLTAWIRMPCSANSTGLQVFFRYCDRAVQLRAEISKLGSQLSLYDSALRVKRGGAGIRDLREHAVWFATVCRTRSKEPSWRDTV